MKQKLFNAIKIILVALMITVMPGLGRTVSSETTAKELAAGVIYHLGEGIKLSGDKYVMTDDNGFSEKVNLVKSDTYTLPQSWSGTIGLQQYYIKDMFTVIVGGSEQLADFAVGYDTLAPEGMTPIGVRCSSGNGTQEAPYTFELMYRDPVTVSFDVGENHGNTVSALLEGFKDLNYPASATGSIVTAIIPGEKNYLYMSLRVMDILDGNPWIDNSDVLLAFALNSLSTYSSYTEINNELMDCYSQPVEDGQVFYSVWADTPIESVSLSIDSPIAGDVVTASQDPETGDYIESTQNPRPTVTSNDENANYSIPLLNGSPMSNWNYLDGDYTELFVGTFVKDNDYYASFFIEADIGYYFVQNLAITVNGGEPYLSGNIGTAWFDVLAKLKAIEQEQGYKCIDDNVKIWTKGSPSSLTFTFKGSPEDDAWNAKNGIQIDGKDVSKEGNYDESEGSWIIELKPEFLKTLSAGGHELTAKFIDFPSATAKFTINENKDSGGGSSSDTVYRLPKTGIE